MLRFSYLRAALLIREFSDFKEIRELEFYKIPKLTKFSNFPIYKIRCQIWLDNPKHRGLMRIAKQPLCYNFVG